MIDQTIRARIEAAYDRDAERYDGKVNRSRLAEEFAGQASRATVFRFCEIRGRSRGKIVSLPVELPKSNVDLIFLFRWVTGGAPAWRQKLASGQTAEQQQVEFLRRIAGQAL
jgi:hypothetical protein